MIMVKLKGGMGNQLFQYAVGRALAEKNNTELKLDTSWYGVVPDRQYDLDHYNISGTIATPAEISKMSSLLTRIVDRLKPFNRRTLIVEQSFKFDPEVLQLGDNVCLDGYWQSPKYFNEIAPIIRQEFMVKGRPSGKNADYFEEIQSTTAVSLHVRRGDYVSNKNFNNYHGTSPLEYYEKAVAMVAEKVKKPHFFIFSDDSAWTKENLKFDYPMTFVTGNDKTAEEDIRLMSSCQHFIIANSTFSWWGAWLAGNKDKMVIAPKVWFAARPGEEVDLIPEEWIRL